MAEQIEQQIEAGGLQNQVEVDFNAEYVKLTLNGAILFDSAKANIREDAQPLIAKIGTILENYDSNVIEIEGHTENMKTIMYCPCTGHFLWRILSGIIPHWIRH